MRRLIHVLSAWLDDRVFFCRWDWLCRVRGPLPPDEQAALDRAVAILRGGEEQG